MKTLNWYVWVGFLLVLSLLGASATWGQASVKPFVVGLPSEPDVLDVIASRAPPAAWASLDNIVEPLVGKSIGGNIAPGLASWTISPDEKTITFHLRKGVKFHSGDPLTARDVEFSHKRSIEKNPRYPGRLRFFDRLEIVDDYTVNFIFKQPDAAFVPSRYLSIVSKSYYDRVGEAKFVSNPVGTGPYKFVDYKVGQYLDLEAFEDYWEGAPPIKKVRLVYVKDDSTRVAMLEAGEADIIMGTPFARVGELRKKGFKIVNVPSHPTVALGFNYGNPKNPWADKRVRLAIAEAIDTNAIVNGLFQGIPHSFARLEPGAFAYDSSIVSYKYDPAHAKKLLAEAGYPKGFSIPFYYYGGLWPGFKETAEAVTLYLKAVGIDARAQAKDGTELNDMLRKNNTNPEILATGRYMVLYPFSLANIGDPTANLTVQMYSQAAFSLYANPSFDKILDLALHTLDDKKRSDYLRAAIKIMHEDVASIPLWYGANVEAMKANVDYAPVLKQIPRMDLKTLRQK